MDLEKFEVGDKVLFNDRKTPLDVVEASSEKLLVRGPAGGEYKIYFDNDTLLVCKPGNEDYSSYCKELRDVGEWVRDSDKWRHSKSEALIEIVEKDNGFWTLESEKFGDELDIPMYGYSGKEYAIEDVEKFVGKRPEG